MGEDLEFDDEITRYMSPPTPNTILDTKKYIEQIMQNRDVKGAKIMVGGRLDGAEIARTETLTRGRLPLTTLRANIDYGLATAFTTYGTIGVKVWIYKGEIFNK